MKDKKWCCNCKFYTRYDLVAGRCSKNGGTLSTQWCRSFERKEEGKK